MGKIGNGTDSGKWWHVFEADYPEEGPVGHVLARSAAGAVATVQGWAEYRLEGYGDTIPVKDRVELVAVRTNDLRRARATLAGNTKPLYLSRFREDGQPLPICRRRVAVTK